MSIKIFTDQMGRTIKCPFPPRRIISLVPSQTELLCTLGLTKQLVGRTKFCIHPKDQLKDVAIIGGTKKLHFDRIEKLKPDLVIGNKEENEKTQIEQLANTFPVWMSDITTLPDALEMITKIGELTDRQKEGGLLAGQIEQGLNRLPGKSAGPLRVAYLIWRKPYMAVGGNTFINSMIEAAGFENVLAGRPRYPEITAAELEALQPDVLLLSSEPYPFKSKHLEECRQICPKAVIHLVDGELFSWYGSRLLLAVPYLLKLRFKLDEKLRRI